jgi:aldehyde:ferredoxin oxidoreductase
MMSIFESSMETLPSVTGYLGKLLIVDLTTGEMRDEPLNMSYARQFIGNSGLAARYLYDMVQTTHSS